MGAGVIAVVVGCGGGSSGDSTDGEDRTDEMHGAGGAGGEETDAAETEGSGEVTPECREGCEATLAAACPIGPLDQESCEQDCMSFRAGDCEEEYRVFQECADGKEVTCGSIGIPVVEDCAAEQDMFIGCLN